MQLRVEHRGRDEHKRPVEPLYFLEKAGRVKKIKLRYLAYHTEMR